VTGVQTCALPIFLCTLKFQGETDHATARAFAAIPGSQLLHLSCNKHELTWALVR
jgi:23S rRNA (cytidine2498-2'-O)-methyltransferase